MYHKHLIVTSNLSIEQAYAPDDEKGTAKSKSAALKMMQAIKDRFIQKYRPCKNNKTLRKPDPEALAYFNDNGSFQSASVSQSRSASNSSNKKLPMVPVFEPKVKPLNA